MCVWPRAPLKLKLLNQSHLMPICSLLPRRFIAPIFPELTKSRLCESQPATKGRKDWIERRSVVVEVFHPGHSSVLLTFSRAWWRLGALDSFKTSPLKYQQEDRS